MTSGRRELPMNTSGALRKSLQLYFAPAANTVYATIILVVSLSVIFFTEGCLQHRPEGKRLTAEQFAAIYADLLVQGEASRQAGFDSVLAQAAADSVLERAGVTRNQYRATVDWLNEDPARWKEVGDEATRMLGRRESTRR